MVEGAFLLVAYFQFEQSAEGHPGAEALRRDILHRRHGLAVLQCEYGNPELQIHRKEVAFILICHIEMRIFWPAVFDPVVRAEHEGDHER